MKKGFEIENSRLRWSWDRYSRDHLDAYLVEDVEDPRINCQSILSRALIADSLWPREFTGLIDAEIRFGAVLSWILGQLRGGRTRQDIRRDLTRNTNGSCPPVVPETFHWLQSDECPIPDYLSAALDCGNVDRPGQLLCERALDTFCDIWQMALRGCASGNVHILEWACGSGNDYRWIERYGLSAFFYYTGVDISVKNIANARTRCPEADFRMGSILDNDLEDESFDYVFVHDLFEHLSPPALEKALAEVLRVTRFQAWLHFFNVKRCGEHLVESVERYHWNTLSLERLCGSITELGGKVETISIPDYLVRKFGHYPYHNANAVTLLVTK